MNTTERSATAACLVVVAAALVAPFASAATHDRAVAGEVSSAARLHLPSRMGRGGMHWYRWQPAVHRPHSRASLFGSTAVIGLESMRDLASLQANYGFERVRAIPAPRAAEVSADAVRLRALLRRAPADPRLRYVYRSGRRPRRRASRTTRSSRRPIL